MGDYAGIYWGIRKDRTGREKGEEGFECEDEGKGSLGVRRG